jgi:Tfp pilus assembly protein PilX
MNNRIHKKSERGLALLMTLLVTTVLLAVGSSLINITLKQYQFSGIGLQSEIAFQAANAGVECISYHDSLGFPVSKFDVPDNGTTVAPETGIRCMEQTSNDLVNNGNSVSSGEEQRFRFTWKNTSVASSPSICTDVSIYKFSNANTAQDMSAVLGKSATCAPGVVCTVIKSRGYNVPCGSLQSPRTIEREFTLRY